MNRKARGQAIVELAVLTPVFLVFVLGMLDIGRAFYFQEAIINAAREGARYGASIGATAADAGDIAQHARDGAASLQPSGNFSVTSTIVTPDYVEVATQYEFDLLTPMVQGMLGRDSFILRARSRMPNAPALPD